LERYRAEWRESPPKRKKRVLAKALAYCSNHRLPDPAWLHDAIYQPARAQVVGLKNSGRKLDLVSDGELYETVEDYRGMGLTEEQAFDRTARDYKEELTRRSIKRPRPTDYSPTVKSAWVRNKKRIVKGIDPDTQGGENVGWYFKKEYLKQGKDYIPDEDIPAYLKTENRKPPTRAEIEDGIRALRLAFASQRTKNKQPRS
jgi:hypothetical protein